MKVTPVAKAPAVGGTPLQRTFHTQQSPSMQAKMREAAKAAPPPSGVAGGKPDAGIPSFEKAQRQAQAGQPLARQLGITPPNQTTDPAIIPAQNASETTHEGTTTPGEAKTGALNPQLAALARHQRQLRKAQIELQAQKDAFQQERRNYVSKDELRTNTLKALTDAGLTYDQLVEQQLTQTPADPVAQLNAKIKELEEKLNGTSKSWEESQSQRDLDARKQAVQQIDKDAELLVNSDPAFETTKTTKQHHEVTKLIEKIFDEEGVIISVEDAARQVEEHLVETRVQEIQQLSQLAKIKAKLAPLEPAAANSGESVPSQKQVPRQPPQVKTLTNSHGVQRPLSARERGILAFQRAKLGT